MLIFQSSEIPVDVVEIPGETVEVVTNIPGAGGTQSILVSGEVATYPDLAGIPNKKAGGLYRVVADDRYYVWDGTSFPPEGSGLELTGRKGDKGDTGNGIETITISGNSLVFDMTSGPDISRPVPALTDASNAAAAAAGSATAAAGSASSASGSAGTAASKATDAATAATNAGNSATAAAGSATAAGNSATAASGSATTADTRASAAELSASYAATAVGFAADSATDAQSFAAIAGAAAAFTVAAAESSPGAEIGYTLYTDQFTATTANWETIPGFEVTLPTAERPVYLTLDLGLLAVEGVVESATSINYRILDLTHRVPVAAGCATADRRTAGGVGSEYLLTQSVPLTARLAAGLPDTRYVVQVQLPADQVGPAWYLNVSWAEGIDLIFKAVIA